MSKGTMMAVCPLVTTISVKVWHSVSQHGHFVPVRRKLQAVLGVRVGRKTGSVTSSGLFSLFRRHYKCGISVGSAGRPFLEEEKERGKHWGFPTKHLIMDANATREGYTDLWVQEGRNEALGGFVKGARNSWTFSGGVLKAQVPHSVFEEMKYLELMIVSDHRTVSACLLGGGKPKCLSRGSSLLTPAFLSRCPQYKRHKSKQHTNNVAKSVVNLVDAVFKEQLHTRVVLVGTEVWTDKDQIPISVKPMQMLWDFSKYRQHHIKKQADAVHLFSNVTFHYGRSSIAYFGGICSLTRGTGVNEYGTTMEMASFLLQSLAQNLGIQWDPASRRKECVCLESWAGCIMEETGVQHSRKFSKCSIADYKEFLKKGGGSCLFNKPTKLFEATECGNGYVEPGEECDCAGRAVSGDSSSLYGLGHLAFVHVSPDCYGNCCKKCSLSNGAHCSDGPCCNVTCQFYPRGYDCRYSVNECDITEICTGDSGQGRCYNGECKTRDNQCQYVWGPKASGSDKLCYEKLNTEGTEKGNCGRDGDKWIQCSKHGGHVLLDDETNLGYVEDGTPCGPSMMCLDRKCLPIHSLNMSTCPTGSNGHVCSAHGVCNSEATCACNSTWAGTDCSIYDPIKKSPPSPDTGPKDTHPIPPSPPLPLCPVQPKGHSQTRRLLLPAAPNLWQNLQHGGLASLAA
ncbi:ADA23 protein, partial [Polypterus senegalus]